MTICSSGRVPLRWSASRSVAVSVPFGSGAVVRRTTRILLREDRPMRADMTKVEDAVLALMAFFAFDECVAWRTYDFGVPDALFEKGFIGDPRSKDKSTVLTPDGLQRGKELAARLFAP